MVGGKGGVETGFNLCTAENSGLLHYFYPRHPGFKSRHRQEKPNFKMLSCIFAKKTCAALPNKLKKLLVSSIRSMIKRL